MSRHRQLIALLLGIILLFAGCVSMKEEAPHSPKHETEKSVNASNPSAENLPGLDRLRQIFRDMETDRRDPDARRVSPAVRQKGEVTVLGVYRVRAPEPCHLIEMRITGIESPFDFGTITHPKHGVGRSFWQVPWMETLLSTEGARIVATSSQLRDRPELLHGAIRVAYFLHDLDLTRPLETPFGSVDLPEPSAKPRRLRALRYEEPD